MDRAHQYQPYAQEQESGILRSDPNRYSQQESQQHSGDRPASTEWRHSQQQFIARKPLPSATQPAIYAQPSTNATAEKTASYSYEPVADLYEHNFHSKQTWRQKHMTGWRFSTGLCATAVLIVLIVNIGAAIHSVRQYGGSPTSTFKSIYVGNCAKTKTLNTVLHLVINVLSTVLLSGSNYCMQVLTAPSREDVNAAHARRRWLDIGIPSIRNLRSMSLKRKILWAILLLSSAPLHLVYNSVFSQSWTRQAYFAALVTEDFVNGADFYAGGSAYDNIESIFGRIQANATSYERLTPAECIEAYNKKVLLDRKNVLVVTSSLPSESRGEYSSCPDTLLPDGRRNSIYGTQEYVGNSVAMETWAWMCSTRCEESWIGCDLTDVLAGREEWSPFTPGITVDYCLSEYMGEQCTLDFSFGLMMVVCVFNLVKLVCMILLVFSGNVTPLLNIGDAASSFLDSPDPSTQGMCLAGKYEVNRRWARKSAGPIEPLTYSATRQRWQRAVSWRRWLFFGLLSAGVLLTTLVLLGMGINNSRTKGQMQFTFGVADVERDPLYVITMGHGTYQPSRIMANILLANLPQLVISFIFMVYNSILSAMCLAKEWSDYAFERKPLRSTAPKGEQRGTYYLSLPFRFAIPLMLSSILLHWLVSQAIFLDRRTVYEAEYRNDVESDSRSGSVSTVGYSPLAIVLCFVWGLIMVVALVAMGFRRLRSGIPFAASCSAAISAACHAPPEERGSSTLPLMWGVVRPARSDGVGHCSFSSRDVSEPLADARYAG